MTRFTVCLYSLMLLCASVCLGPGRAMAQNNAYTITQITPATEAFDHKWPSMNNVGDKVWCQKVGSFWQVFLNGSQKTSGDFNYQYPVVDDNHNVYYVKYGVGQGVARAVVLHPNGTIEFSSRNQLTGAHRDAGEHFGVSSNGTVISYHDFDPRGGNGDNARFFSVSGLGTIYEDFNFSISSRIDFPDINKDNDIVYYDPGSGSIVRAKATAKGFTSTSSVASGIEPRIADRIGVKDPEIVYISGNQVVSTKNGTVDKGLWADVDNAGDVIYEQAVNGISQIFLAKTPFDITEMRLGLPSFVKESPYHYHLAVPCYFKGQGNGKYSGRWQINNSDYTPLGSSQPTDLTIDLSSGKWTRGPELDIPFFQATNAGYSILFSLDAPNQLTTTSLTAKGRPFLPDRDAWPVANDGSWFFGYFYQAFDGMCLGMTVEAKAFYLQGSGLPKWKYPGQLLCVYAQGKANQSLLVDDARTQHEGVSSNAIEAARIASDIASFGPQVIGLRHDLSGNGGGHAFLGVDAFYGKDLYDEFPYYNQEVSDAWIFPSYDPNFPNNFNELYVAQTANAYYVGYSADDPVGTYRNFQQIFEYTGPYSW